jgi:hypothetical protein
MVMAISARTFLRSLIGMFAMLFGGLARAQQSPSTPSEKLTMSAFIARLRNDSALRARFAENPRGILREHGIDPAPYNLPDRVSEEQMERLLADLAREARPPQPPRPDAPRPLPAPVYGPPPGAPRRP